MSSIWLKVLTAINEVNVVLQAREATIDVKVSNLANLMEQIQFLRGSFQNILNECETVAEQMEGLSSTFP